MAVGSGLILVLEIPVALRLSGVPSYPIIAVGYALVGVGIALFGLPVSVVSAVVAMVVLTAGEILYKTTATAHVLDAAPDHLVGQYQGLYNGASTSGSLLAAPDRRCPVRRRAGPRVAAVPGRTARSRRRRSSEPGSGRGGPGYAKPGRYSVRISRKATSASSWLRMPIAPSHVRWMRRYDGGRLIFSATVYDGSRGLLTRWNWLCIHVAREAEALRLRRLDERRQVVQQQPWVDPHLVLDEPLAAQSLEQLLVVLDRRDADQRAHRQRQLALGQPGHGAEVEHAHPSR